MIEYGALPIASWLGHIDSTNAVLQLLKQLTEASAISDRNQQGESPGSALSATVPLPGSFAV